jgi:hypothetical protein
VFLKLSKTCGECLSLCDMTIERLHKLLEATAAVIGDFTLLGNTVASIPFQCLLGMPVE